MDITHKRSEDADDAGDKLNLPKISFTIQRSMVESILEIILSAETLEPSSP